MRINETYADIITRLSLAKGAAGTVIDVRCPPSYKMVLVGSSQLQQDAVQLPEDYDTVVSSIMIRFANTENIEIDPDIRIKIVKEKLSQSISIIDTMFYKDISATAYTKTSENETKQLEEQYVFDRGIEVNGGEHLMIEALYPNICIDASNTRFSLGLDLWEQE